MDLCGLHVAVRWKPGGWGRGRIPVWGPAATADRMATAYGLDLDPGMHEEFDFTNWTEREPVTVGPFTVTPFAVNHPVEEAYALRVEVTEPDKEGNPVSRVLTYSGRHRFLRRAGGSGQGRGPVPLRGGLRGRPRRRHQGRAPDRKARRARPQRLPGPAGSCSRTFPSGPRPPRSWPRPGRSSAATWPLPWPECTTRFKLGLAVHPVSRCLASTSPPRTTAGCAARPARRPRNAGNATSWWWPPSEVAEQHRVQRIVCQPSQRRHVPLRLPRGEPVHAGFGMDRGSLGVVLALAGIAGRSSCGADRIAADRSNGHTDGFVAIASI